MPSTLAARITKSFGRGETRQVVLDDLALELSAPDLVVILGESGCGKTTLLNILGGLDRHFEGQLLVDGRSTADFSSADWDRFRAQRVGLVFQSPNLIGHLSVLENVLLGQDLAGVPDQEARASALRALERCGIADLADRIPSTLSGGQAQRACVARALAKDPRVILADEPTGSLDEKSGERVMELLAELARERLVLVVTHNERLARAYATRVITIRDGRVATDERLKDRGGHASGPQRPQERRGRHRSRVLGLSMHHLLRKKARSALTAIAVTLAAFATVLVLSIAAGSHGYLEGLSLSLALNHPLLASTSPSIDIFTEGREAYTGETPGLRVSPTGTEALNRLASPGASGEDLGGLYSYLTDAHPEIASTVLDIQRDYQVELNLYGADGTQLLSAGSPVLAERLSREGLIDPELQWMLEANAQSSRPMQELVINDVTGESPYDVLAGRMPASPDEVVIIVRRDATMADLVAAELGLLDDSRIREMVEAEEPTDVSIAFEDLLGTTYRIVPTADYYYQDEKTGAWVNSRTDGSPHLSTVIDRARTLSVVGVVCPEERFDDASFAGAIGYDAELVEQLVADAWNTKIVRDQAENPQRDVFSGRDFDDGMAKGALTAGKLVDVAEQIGLSTKKIERLRKLTDDDASTLAGRLGYVGGDIELDDSVIEQLVSLTDDEFSRLVDRYVEPDLSASYRQNMIWLGGAQESSPSALRIYVEGAEQREMVLEAVDDYVRLAGLKDGDVSCQTDIEAVLSEARATVATIDLALALTSIVLGALSVFLVASTTSVSALERTGEIAVLRALGATKADVTALFCAENLLIGALGGLISGMAAWALSPYLDSLVLRFTHSDGLVTLGPASVLAAVILSALVTTLAGIASARGAAGRDPASVVRNLTV